jgi:polygalacturonase
LFGKDLRITTGKQYREEREFDYSSYLPVDKYVNPCEKPSQNVFDIRDFGAVPDSKETDNAPAINACINACSEAGGGAVLIDGGAYTSRTVELKSGVTLFVCANSSITAHESGEGFDNMCLLHAQNCSNITLTGGGTVNGNGHLFGRKPLYDSNLTEPDEVIDVIKMRRDYRAQLRFAHPSKYGRLVCFEGCSDVCVNNIILQDSPSWTLRLTRCSRVKIEDIVINDNRHVANTDGIDLMQSSDVDIRHCFISCADDGIVLKNAVWERCDGDMHGIHVSDCEIISCTNAFKIGTETTFGISDVLVENCRFYMTDLYPGSVSGISIESADGSAVENITVRNVEMSRCTCPIFIRLCNRNRAALVNEQSASAVEFGVKAVSGGETDRNRFDMKGRLDNILIENVKARDIELPVIVAGFRQKGKTVRVKNVTLKDIELEYRNAREVYDRRLFIPEYSKEYPECWRFRNLPAYALWARHAENLVTENFTCTPAPNTWKEEKILIDVI